MVLAAVQASWAQSLQEKRLRSQTKYNFLNDFTASSNAQKVDAFDQRISGVYTFGLKYKVNKKNNFWFFARGSKLFYGRERMGLLDSIVRYEHLLGTYKGVLNRARLSVVLPTNDDNHETTSFNGAVSGQIRSGLSLPKNFYLNIVNTLRWNFHQYRISETAGINIQSTFRSSATLSYTLFSKITLAGVFGVSMAKSYENKYRKAYNFDYSGSYSITDKLSASLGYGINANFTKADGRASNIKLFDERNSYYYASLTHFY